MCYCVTQASLESTHETSVDVFLFCELVCLLIQESPSQISSIRNIDYDFEVSLSSGKKRLNRALARNVTEMLV